MIIIAVFLLNSNFIDIMKEKRKLAEIHAEIYQFALKRLREAGFEILPDMPAKIRRPVEANDFNGEQGMSLSMVVVGYSGRYDGWDYDLDESDWQKILSKRWSTEARALLEYMKSIGNRNLSETEVKEKIPVKIHLAKSFHIGTEINKGFKRANLNYHFGFTHTQPTGKNGYPSMIRLFKKPEEVS